MGYHEQTIGSWYEAIEQKLEKTVLQEVQLYADGLSLQGPQELALITEELRERLVTRVQARMDEITVTEFDLVSLDLPDLELYRTAKTFYLELTAVKNSSLQRELVQTAQQRAQNEVKIDLLKRYGTLFEEYPILIQYIEADPELKSLEL
jgi:hypothetical protein